MTHCVCCAVGQAGCGAGCGVCRLEGLVVVVVVVVAVDVILRLRYIVQCGAVLE